MNAGWASAASMGGAGVVVVEEDSEEEADDADGGGKGKHHRSGQRARPPQDGPGLGAPSSLGIPDKSVLAIAMSEWWRALDGPVTQVVQSLYAKSQSRLALVVAFSVVLAILLVSRYVYLQGDLVALFEDGVTPIAFVVSLLSFGAVIMVLLETLQIKSTVDAGLCASIARVQLNAKVAAEALDLRKVDDTDTTLSEI